MFEHSNGVVSTWLKEAINYSCVKWYIDSIYWIILTMSTLGKKPFYNIIAIDKASYIKGKYIDKIGYVEPIKKNDNIQIEIGKINKFLSCGATISK